MLNDALKRPHRDDGDVIAERHQDLRLSSGLALLE
jgi:hypothetical protein